LPLRILISKRLRRVESRRSDLLAAIPLFLQGDGRSGASGDLGASRRLRLRCAPWFIGGLALLVAGCSGGGSSSSGGGGGSTAPTTFVLSVASTNPASGVAIGVATADNTGATNGSTSFTRTYNSGTSVTLTAAASAGSNTFSSWSGCTSASGASCTVTMTGNVTATANYSAPAVYTLTVNSSNPASGVAIGASPADNNGATSGTTSFTRTYTAGTSVTLTAPAASGSNSFSSWSGCTTSSTTTCTVTVSANTTVTANYAVPVYALTVNSANPASGVVIGAAPADNNGKATGTTAFSLSYNAGTAVTLTAPATTGSNTFSSWSGCTSTSGATCTVTVSASKAVTANYSAPTYVLTVNSTSPASGVAISVTPTDNNNKISGSTSFTLTYNSGTAATLTAPATAGGSTFASWSGCTAATAAVCSVTLNANTTVTANYGQPGVTTITVTPGPADVTIGTTQQFTAAVAGIGTYSSGVTWSVAAAAGSTQSAGTISSSGLYTTPYPAPASVTVTATSTQDSTKNGSVTFSLATPATATGPALSVDAGNQTHAISPYIYGMNGYLLDSTTAANANITVVRWGGDDTSRYNYQTGVTNSANDYFFENFKGASGMLGNGDGSFTGFFGTANTLGIAPMGTVPLLGYVSNGTQYACSFTKAAYPGQQTYDPSGLCGNGVEANGTTLNGDSVGNPTTTPALTSIAEPPPAAPGVGNATSTWAAGTWIGGWVDSIVSAAGPGNPSTGARKGVAIWDLDNEPAEWDAVHRDVHPLPFSYDELTNGGIGAALAIKTADPTAQVSGPVMDRWDDYFYSEKDVASGWSTGPCYQFWSNPIDRKAHGGVPFTEYYMQQMKAASATYGVRLLDYVDLHTYFAATYNGATVGLTAAGDTAEQQARLNSTRVFWDSTYTDPNYEQPNYATDANYQATCNNPAQAPQLIPMMQTWVTNDYPGTKTSIDEYNWGGNESINGAVAQADILGIFGKYGLDMAMLWPTTNYSNQGPGNEAFEVYRNYDGNKSTFGDMALASTSAAQGTLSVYGGLRTSDHKITIVVINKTYGPLTSALSIANYAAGTGATAQSYLYSNASLSAIVAQPAVTITPPASGSNSSTITATFPGQSITLLVLP
jgi:hypothetical protein